MASPTKTTDVRQFRELVEFYLLDHETVLGKAIDIALLVLNLVFVAILVAETYPLSELVLAALWQLEVAITIVFLGEYLLRLYGAPNRVAEFFNVYTMVDLIAILPTLSVLVLPFSPLANIGFLRVIRIIRVLRFYRFTQDEAFFFGTVSVGTLRAVKLFLTVLVLFFVSAGMFYSFEHTVNPGVSTFGDAFYYVVVTISTVGFGDILPATTAGRWITILSILAGVVIIPWQASKIIREWTTSEKVDVTCPNCGLSRHDPDASHCKACGHVIYQEYESSE